MCVCVCVVCQNGRFAHNDMSRVWRDYPSELHEWLLRLTEEFDLTFSLPHDPVNLVPCLLPQCEPEVRKLRTPKVTAGGGGGQVSGGGSLRGEPRSPDSSVVGFP